MFAADVIGDLGVGEAVCLVGPAGIGKSTAAARVIADRAPEQPALVAHCLDSLRPLAYRPLAHALGGPLNGTPEHVAVEVAAAVGPRLLVVEDLHWADDATAEVVRLLVGRVSLLVTSRRPDLAPPEMTIVTIQPLDDRRAEALVRRAHPELDADGRRRLVSAAGGNPLLLSFLADGGEVLPSLAAAADARLTARGDLPADTTRRLAMLALHGRPAPADLLGLDTDRAGGLLRAVVAANGSSEVWFVHDLFARSLVDRLDDAELAALRSELAAISEPADAARHLLALGQRSEAARSAVDAAEGVVGVERSALLEFAVEALGDDADDALLLRAAAAHIAAHRTNEARATAERVDGTEAMKAEAGLYLAQAAWLDGRPHDAISIAEAARRLVGGTDSEVETLLVIECAAIAVRERLGDREILSIADEALAAAERVGAGRAKALNTAGLARAHNALPGWRELYEAAAEQARCDGDLEEECAAMFWLRSALGFNGMHREAYVLEVEMLERTAALGLRRWHHHFLGGAVPPMASAGLLTDDLLAGAEALLRTDPLFRNRAQVDLGLVMAYVDRRDLGRAREVLVAGEQHARSDEDRSLHAVARAEIALAADDVNAMIEALELLAAAGRGFFGYNAGAESAAIHLFITRGRRDLTAPESDTSLSPVLDPVVLEREAFHAWRAGRSSDALVAMGRAAEGWKRNALGRFARRARVTEVVLAAGLNGAETYGRTLVAVRDDLAAGQPDHSLRRLDAFVTERDRSRRVAALSPRQLEVLSLVAAGLTTRAIAVRLGLTPATVDSHVADAVRRLECRSRRQAAALVVAVAAGTA